MQIHELAPGTKPDFILQMLEPFQFSAEKLKIILGNFEQELLEIGTNRIVLLGTLGDIPVSTFQLILQNADNNLELANGRDIAHIHNLWVRKDYQRRGLAEFVMRHCEMVALNRGIQTLTLGVDDFNTGAIALYDKLGYTKFAEEKGRTPEEKLFLMRKRIF